MKQNLRLGEKIICSVTLRIKIYVYRIIIGMEQSI